MLLCLQSPLQACQALSAGLGQASGFCHVRPSKKTKQMTTKFLPFFLMLGGRGPLSVRDS